MLDVYAGSVIVVKFNGATTILVASRHSCSILVLCTDEISYSEISRMSSCKFCFS